MNQYTLNDKTFLFEVALIRRGYGPIELALNNIMRMVIINDAYEPFPRLTMTVKDPNSSVIPQFAADNNSKIVVTVMSNELYGDTEHLVKKSHMFNIDRVKPTSFTGENTAYEITAVSELLSKWLSPTSFSTGKDIISTTSAAGNLLIKAGIPYIAPIKESSNKQFFIADMNTPVRDHVQHLLDRASFTGDGFYYTWYDLYENKLRIESTKNIMRNSGFQSYNTITIPSGDYGSNDLYSSRSAHYTNDVSATKIDSISKGIKEFNFDFKTGKFYEKKMEYVDIVNSSTIQNLNPIIDNTINIDSDTNYAQMASGHRWYAEIRKSIRAYNTVALTLDGNIQRNIGDLVLLKSSASLTETFGGIWITMRTVDTYNFGAGKFDQDIIVCRTGKI